MSGQGARPARNRERESFTYAVSEAEDRYLGCCDLYPLGRRTQLTEELLVYDVDVSWWVTTAAYARGRYADLYDAIRFWVASRFPFERAYFSNAEIPPLVLGKA
jgi:hypothetical protein